MKKVRSKLYPSTIGVIKTFSLSQNDEIGEIAVECTGCTYYYNNLEELCEKWEDVPEEPKGVKSIGTIGASVHIEMGSEEEAEKAVEKLEAWKRLKDARLEFRDYHYKLDEDDALITYRIEIEGDGFAYEDFTDDLRLLFGGEE